MKKEKQGMKEQLIGEVARLREKGIDLVKDHPLFKWSYPEMPEIQFQLLIIETKLEETPEIVLH